MDQLVKSFFEEYERANSASDVTSIGNLYADTFTFAGPNGPKAVKKDDFLKVIPKMKAYFASLKLSATRLGSVEVMPLDSKYLLARVTWQLTLQPSELGNNEPIEVRASYILERKSDDALSIIVQIDHQDLSSVIKNRLGGA